jgi:hypothetical protein
LYYKLEIVASPYPVVINLTAIGLGLLAGLLFLVNKSRSRPPAKAKKVSRTAKKKKR